MNDSMSVILIGTAAAIPLLVTGSLPTQAAQAEICVVNQTPDTLYIEIATWTKTQKREVAPTSKFCVEGDSSGEITVSKTPEAYDYCEHLIQPSETELLLRYNFGIYQWAKFIPDS